MWSSSWCRLRRLDDRHVHRRQHQYNWILPKLAHCTHHRTASIQLISRFCCQATAVSFKFHNIRWPAWGHETLLKISRLLWGVQMQPATIDNLGLQYLHKVFSVFSGQHEWQHFEDRIQEVSEGTGDHLWMQRKPYGNHWTVHTSAWWWEPQDTVYKGDADRDKTDSLRGLIDINWHNFWVF